MKVFIEKDGRTLERDFSGKVKSLLNELKIDSNNVLVVVNGELITEEDSVKNSDSVRILSVISGG